MLLLLQRVEHNPPVPSILLQYRGHLQEMLLLLLVHTLPGPKVLQGLHRRLLRSHLAHRPLQEAIKAMGLHQHRVRCIVAIIIIMETTQIAEHHILLASTHLHLGILEHSRIIKLGHTGTE